MITYGRLIFAAAALALLGLSFTAEGARSRHLLQGSAAPAPAPSGPQYFVQPNLPYSYSAQEPYIDTRTQQIHWGVEVALGYTLLNQAAAANSTLQKMTIIDIVKSLTNATSPGVHNPASDILGHNIFFKTLQPDAYDPNSNLPAFIDIGNAIDVGFGDMDTFKSKFTTAAMGVFGSGWAWLTVDPNNNYKMAIETTPNADNPLSTGLGYSGNIPILGCDLWEHAYYLKHANVRADYIKDWFSVLNWPQVDANYKAIMKGDTGVLMVVGGNHTVADPNY